MYLHESVVKFHGSLTTSNCLVDSRWVVKLADFGLHEFKRDAELEPADVVKKYRGTLAPTLIILHSLRLLIYFTSPAVQGAGAPATAHPGARLPGLPASRRLLVWHSPVRAPGAARAVRHHGAVGPGHSEEGHYPGGGSRAVQAAPGPAGELLRLRAGLPDRVLVREPGAAARLQGHQEQTEAAAQRHVSSRALSPYSLLIALLHF